MAPSATNTREGNKVPRKEAFFVRIALPDGSSQFLPATDHLGKVMPFNAPRETCAIRVYDDVVAFSLLHLTKKNAKSLAGKPVAMPSSMLTRLSRRALELGEFTPGRVAVEHGTDLYEMAMTVSEAKVASLDIEGEETPVTLDVRGERVSVYFRSPVSDHLIALGFIGHMGKPGTIETIVRLAAKSLNAALGLSAFQVLAGVETIEVPSRPGLTAAPPSIRSTQFDMPVNLFNETQEPVAAGKVGVVIDLEHSNPSNDRLLFSLVPDSSLEPHFEVYKEICGKFVDNQMAVALSDDAKRIVLDIVLGEVEDSTVERIQSILTLGIPGVDMTPTKFRMHTPE